MASHLGLLNLLERIRAQTGVSRRFTAPVFHEALLVLNAPTLEILAELRGQQILGGLDVSPDYPELAESLLVCVTETKAPQDLERYAASLSQALTSRR